MAHYYYFQPKNTKGRLRKHDFLAGKKCVKTNSSKRAIRSVVSLGSTLHTQLKKCVLDILGERYEN